MKWTKEEIKIGILLLQEGKNFIEISKILNKEQVSVTKKFNRLGYKSGYNNRNKQKSYNTIYETYNWTEIQKKHDNGLSYRELLKQCNLSPHAIIWAKDNKKINFRSISDGVKLSLKKGLGIKSKSEGLMRYRQLCEFKFSLSKYSKEFDFDLIKKYGWYKPKNKGNNLGGVSRDHMYSVKEGFKNNINPDIIAHPSNCQLMIQNENSKKKHKSSITFEELELRIKDWDKKYKK